MFKRAWTRMGLAVSVVIFGSAFIGGCANNRLVTERNQLIMQNKQLQQQLSESRASLASTRTQLQQQQQIAAAAAAQAAASRQQAVATAAEPTGMKNYSTILPPMHSNQMQSRRHSTLMRRSHRAPSVPHRGVARWVLSSDLLFRSGSARLSPRAVHSLLHVAYQLRHKYAGHHVVVEGYTDNIPIRHPYPNNYALGLARARSVLNFLAQHGVSRQRMRAVSFGDHYMVSHTDLALDRRVVVVVRWH